MRTILSFVFFIFLYQASNATLSKEELKRYQDEFLENISGFSTRGLRNSNDALRAIHRSTLGSVADFGILEVDLSSISGSGPELAQRLQNEISRIRGGMKRVRETVDEDGQIFFAQLLDEDYKSLGELESQIASVLEKQSYDLIKPLYAIFETLSTKISRKLDAFEAIWSNQNSYRRANSHLSRALMNKKDALVQSSKRLLKQLSSEIESAYSAGQVSAARIYENGKRLVAAPRRNVENLENFDDARAQALLGQLEDSINFVQTRILPPAKASRSADNLNVLEEVVTLRLEQNSETMKLVMSRLKEKGMDEAAGKIDRMLAELQNKKGQVDSAGSDKGKKYKFLEILAAILDQAEDILQILDAVTGYSNPYILGAHIGVSGASIILNLLNGKQTIEEMVESDSVDRALEAIGLAEVGSATKPAYTATGAMISEVKDQADLNEIAGTLLDFTAMVFEAFGLEESKAGKVVAGIQKFKGIAEKVVEYYDKFMEMLDTKGYHGIANAIRKVMDFIKDLRDKIWNAIVEVGKKVVNVFASFLSTIGSWLGFRYLPYNELGYIEGPVESYGY